LYKGNSEEKHQIRAIFQEQRERRKEASPRSVVPESICDNKTNGKQLEKLLVRCACITAFLLLALDEAKRKEKKASPWIFTVRIRKQNQKKKNLKMRN
jgi:hypothetical protein